MTVTADRGIGPRGDTPFEQPIDMQRVNPDRTFCMRGESPQPLYRPVSAAIGRDLPDPSQIHRAILAILGATTSRRRFARRLLQRKVDHDTGKQTDVGTLLADHLHHGMRRPPDDRTTTAGQRRTSDYVAHLPVGGAAGRAGLGNVFPVKPTPNELLLGCVERHRSNCLHLQIQFVWATVMRKAPHTAADPAFIHLDLFFTTAR